MDRKLTKRATRCDREPVARNFNEILEHRLFERSYPGPCFAGL